MARVGYATLRHRISLLLIPLVVVVQLLRCIPVLLRFWMSLLYFVRGGKYIESVSFYNDKHAKTYLYSLGLVIQLWNVEHFRGGTYAQDLRHKLRSTAVPGTGIPLSVFLHFRLTALLFMFVALPIIAIVMAVLEDWKCSALSHAFRENLLHPCDWCSLWILNSSLAVHHYHLVAVPGYNLEDKWLFLKQASQAGFTVVPWKRSNNLSISHSNESTSFYHRTRRMKGANANGDWIVLKKMQNSEFIRSFVPDDAPLVTFRIVTGWNSHVDDSIGVDEDDISNIVPFSCVMRSTSTESKSTEIIFRVDIHTGELLEGTTNSHWHRIGWRNIGKQPLQTSFNLTRHPESHVKVTGRVIENMESILEMVRKAHSKLLAHVPLAGWDVVLTDDGIKILEVNLSSNFHRASLDYQQFFSFVDKHFTRLSLCHKITEAIE